ncbi:hypothetical protein EOL26_23565 [Escherichia coli]|nr:hypothetical protein EOL26_23565 [Escherichia coli]
MASSGQTHKVRYFLYQNAIESVLQGNLMVNLPPELGSPDVWAGGGIPHRPPLNSLQTPCT